MFGIAMYRPAKDQNVGGMLRTAHVFKADAFCIIGASYHRCQADTTNATKHLAFSIYEAWADFRRAWNGTCSLIAVENSSSALSLSAYRHPGDAIYILGNEKLGLPDFVLGDCDAVIAIDTPNPWPLNVTTAGSIVVAHRYASAVDRVTVW